MNKSAEPLVCLAFFFFFFDLAFAFRFFCGLGFGFGSIGDGFGCVFSCGVLDFSSGTLSRAGIGTDGGSGGTGRGIASGDTWGAGFGLTARRFLFAGGSSSFTGAFLRFPRCVVFGFFVFDRQNLT